MSGRGNVQLEECPVAEIIAWANIWWGKCQLGEVSVGNCPVGDASVGKCRSGKCPVGEVSGSRY